jgi:DNA-binding NtrC family response regulator
MLQERNTARLNVVTIVVAPLGQRGADALMLAEHFLDRFTQEYGRPAKR